MFGDGKLGRIRRRCDREIAIVRHALSSDPTRFSPAERSELDAAASRLELACRKETDANFLVEQLHAFNASADAYLPIWRNSKVREWIEAIAVALVLALFIRTFVIQAFKIPSGSMIPTLLIGDHLIVNKFIYGFEVPFSDKKVLPIRLPRRGEIIVFRPPHEPSKDYIKRVVGLPGDHIDIRRKHLFINGNEVPLQEVGLAKLDENPEAPADGVLFEETLDGHKHPVLFSSTGYTMYDTKSWVVPEGHYFCMGDNRDRSNDSRYWGFVDFNRIRGKAMVIYFSWPPSQWTRIGSITR